MRETEINSETLWQQLRMRACVCVCMEFASDSNCLFVWKQFKSYDPKNCLPGYRWCSFAVSVPLTPYSTLCIWASARLWTRQNNFYCFSTRFISSTRHSFAHLYSRTTAVVAHMFDFDSSSLTLRCALIGNRETDTHRERDSRVHAENDRREINI